MTWTKSPTLNGHKIMVNISFLVGIKENYDEQTTRDIQ